ncbi:MAG: Lon protease [Planctomycetota bacterium]|nr:MAG: Lon protease [Planctomycetota bacterium]
MTGSEPSRTSSQQPHPDEPPGAAAPASAASAGTSVAGSASTAAPATAAVSPTGERAADTVPIVPMRGAVVFPRLTLPIAVGRRRSLEAVQEAVRGERPLGLLLQKDPEVEEPGPDDLYHTGTLVHVLRFVTGQDGGHALCQGQHRFRVIEFVQTEPYLLARIEQLPEPEQSGDREIEARTLALRQQALEALELLPQAPPEIAAALRQIEPPGLLADMIATFIDARPEDKQRILETVDVRERLERVARLLAERIEILKLSKRIGEQTRSELDKRQREFLLRQQLKTIQEELGEGDSKGLEELRRAIAEAGMPEEVEQEARKELARLERMPEAAAEYSMVRTYLELLCELPWSKLSEDRLEIARARAILDEDHHDLEKVKRRILEHLAVRKLNPEGKSPILCFVGPPGVGKTSLGRSIARAMGREFVRASLGGVHDESEIRGHRRTYVGALPGRIIQGIRRAGTRNPVFMLDEVDKLGAGLHGDPAAALLEVLDPEQNSEFRDNYLGVPFDLSRVMFICTANVIDQIPKPLRDRMEVIELPGYTEQDKLEIARRYLVGRQLAEAGLKPEQCEITDEALRKVIADYTREAGCRELERRLGALCRHVATRVAAGEIERMRIGPEEVRAILGPEKYEREVAMRTSVPGVATGLAWTPAGGEILFVEATRMPGKGNLLLTGQLGDVMKESAQAALSLVRANLERLGLEPGALQETDIHIHVPAGAIPKDGPSAGVAMYVALVSLFTGRCVRSDVAMTGEISLRGLVLPVGGIKEKVLAALSAGIRTVLLPARNKKDLEEIPEQARQALRFVWLERVEDAVAAALEPPAEEQPADRERTEPVGAASQD